MKCPYCGKTLEQEFIKPWKPQLESERLIIRRFLPTDGKGLHNYLSDPNVVKYEPYPPLEEQQCEKAAENMAELKDFWAVCLKGNGELAGQIYLSEREQQSWELGYVFPAGRQGRGYASEAVSALLDALFLMEGPHRVTANCSPDNERSWRLLERLGFRREGHLKQNVAFTADADGRSRWQDTYVYGLLREEWKTFIS